MVVKFTPFPIKTDVESVTVPVPRLDSMYSRPAHEDALGSVHVTLPDEV